MGFYEGLWMITWRLLAVIGCSCVSILLIRFGTREPKQPPIPPAHVEHLRGIDAAYAKAARTPRWIGRGLAVTLGVPLLIGPWAYAAWWLMQSP